MKRQTYSLGVIGGGIALAAIFASVGFAPVSKPVTPLKQCCTQSAVDAPNGVWSLSLDSGSQYGFTLNSTSGVPSGGTWSSQFDTIDSTGKYTAPTVFPPDGIDTVKYVSPSGTTLSWVTRTAPTSSTENPYSVPQGIYTTADTTTPMTDDQKIAEYANQMARGDSLATVPIDGKWHEILQTASVANTNLAAVADCTELVLATTTVPPAVVVPPTPVPAPGPAPAPAPGTTTTPAVQSLQMTTVAQTNLANNALLLLLPLDKPKPKNCKIGPLYPPPPYKGQPCNPPGATQKVNGPVKVFTKRGAWNNDAGSITVTAELAADLWKWLKVKVTVGLVLKFGRQPIDYKAIYNYDRYKCVNGVWTYAGSGTCESIANGEVTSPAWVAWIDGYPMDGGPRQWSPWQCHDIP